MINTLSIVRAFLAANAGVTAIAGARVYASARLPTGYAIGTGPAVVFSQRGGAPDYSGKLLEPSLQVRCYGATEALAISLDRAVYDALHEQRSKDIHWSRCDVLGQLLVEPDTGWPFVLSYWTVWVGNP